MNIRILVVFLFLIRMVNAADVQSVSIWRTVGDDSGAGWGATLLNVEKTSDGSIVRFVYAGVGDFVCRRNTVMLWQKRIAGKTPTELARPWNLCPSESRLKELELSLALQHSVVAHGIESDSAELRVQCDETKLRGLPIEFADPFESNVRAAAWGQYMPDFYAIDSAAERDGQEFAANVPQWGLGQDDASEKFRRYLLNYKGPIGQPLYDWRIEPEGDVRLQTFVEPGRIGPVESHLSKSISIPLRLTVDRPTGKVTKSEALIRSTDPRISAVSEVSRNWIFDPSTIPENGVVNVQVHFQANCGGDK